MQYIRFKGCERWRDMGAPMTGTWWSRMGAEVTLLWMVAKGYGVLREVSSGGPMKGHIITEHY